MINPPCTQRVLWSRSARLRARTLRAAAAVLRARPSRGPRPGPRRVLVAMFCTFAVSPAASLAGMRQALEERGAVVVAEGAFGPRARDISENAAAFAERLLTAAWPEERRTCS